MQTFERLIFTVGAACCCAMAACSTAPAVDDADDDAVVLTSEKPMDRLCGRFEHAGYRGGRPLPDTTGSPGRTFGPGRFVIREQINLRDGEVLRGAGSGRTTLFFPSGLMDLGVTCPNPKDCWSWGNALVRAQGKDIGVEGLTIEFPPHTFVHYGRQPGDQRGFNGVEFRECSNCWARDVAVLHSDVGIYVHDSRNVTITDTLGMANQDGSHIHYAISAHSEDVLIEDFVAGNPSNHGITAQWGAHGVYVDGLLIGGVRLEPEHNGPVARTLYRNIRGNVSSVQSRNRQKEPVHTTFIDVNGEAWGLPCNE